ncbi:hypothetical protein Acr_04g0005920 [Actinidia rufa]|uniref:Uncharacterized protein n=1 Tax=Actinidia rufa TaxID=165716 RepID=A0A7J0EH95_9ERIC|nr:hypothetical protein Acr_04g0005920 [Actinidia rufa]
MLVVDTLMHQVELPFSVMDLMHVYTVVWPKRESGTPFFKVNGNSELGMMASSRSLGTKAVFLTINFNDLFKTRFKECKVDIQAVNHSRASRKVTNLLTYEPVYRHIIPHKVDELSRIRLPALRIEGYQEGITLSSSSYTSLDFSDSEEEEGEEMMSQLLLNKRRGEVVIAHPFKEGSNSDMSSGEVNMTPRPSSGSLNFPPSSEFSTVDLGKQVIMANSAKNHDTSLALTQVIMLPKDVADLVEKSLEKIHFLLLMQQRATAISEQMKDQSTEIKKSKKKISFLEKQAKLDSKAKEKAKLNLALAVQERDASYATIIEARGIDRAKDNYDKQLAELHPGIFKKGWMASLKELDIPSDHLAWSVALLESSRWMLLKPILPSCCLILMMKNYWRKWKTSSQRSPPRWSTILFRAPIVGCDFKKWKKGN